MAFFITLADELLIRINSDVVAGQHGLLARGPKQSGLWSASLLVGQYLR